MFVEISVNLLIMRINPPINITAKVRVWPIMNIVMSSLVTGRRLRVVTLIVSTGRILAVRQISNKWRAIMEIGIVGFGGILVLGAAVGVVVSLLAPKTYVKIQNTFRKTYMDIKG